MTDIRQTLIEKAKTMGWKIAPAQAEQFSNLYGAAAGVE